jgi:hypothetical protein
VRARGGANVNQPIRILLAGGRLTLAQFGAARAGKVGQAFRKAQMKRLLLAAALTLGVSGCAEMQADMRTHPEQYIALSQAIHQATVDYGNSIDRPPNPACHQGNVIYC